MQDECAARACSAACTMEVVRSSAAFAPLPQPWYSEGQVYHRRLIRADRGVSPRGLFVSPSRCRPQAAREAGSAYRARQESGEVYRTVRSKCGMVPQPMRRATPSHDFYAIVTITLPPSAAEYFALLSRFTAFHSRLLFVILLRVRRRCVV